MRPSLKGGVDQAPSMIDRNGNAMTRLRCAILDDYLNLALKVADWSKVEDRVDVTVFNHPFATTEAAAKGAWQVSQKSAGLYASCAKGLKSRDIAMLGSDAASDVMPSGVEGVAQPIHTLVLVAMGMPIFDNCDLELISRETEKRQRWEFLVTASPAAVPGGTGSVLNPIATF